MARSKKATKKATKKASPKVRTPTPKKQASQLQVLTQAREHFGKKYPDQIRLMSELDNTVPGYVSTQSLALDWIIGNNGAPMSRIVDASGDEGVGKSTVGDHLMAQMQAIGGHAWLWDTENARDDRYQEKVGIVRKRAGQILSHTLEDGFEVMIDLLTWHLANDPDRPGIILWDTPAGTPTRAEADPEKKDERFGPAKLIRGNIRKLNQILQQTKWILCVINQTYMGQNMSGQTYKAVYGGGGIPFYSSVRLSLGYVSQFWRTSTDKEMKLPPIGQTVWVKCIKSRVSIPHRSKQICILFGEGIDNTWEIFNTLVGAGCIKQAGGWYGFDPDYNLELATKYPDKWQGGFMALKEMIKVRPEMWGDLMRVYESLEIK